MKTIEIEYGDGFVPVTVPEHVVVKGMSDPPAPLEPETAIQEALTSPIQAPALYETASGMRQSNPQAQAVIVVSDNTRPVPYRGRGGLMVHIIRTLLNAGFAEQQVTVLIGAGSHRNMEPNEIEQMLGLAASGLGGVAVVNHEYDLDEQLVDLGLTSRGSRVLINRTYMEADLKIVTGLVESHFMAGASGGRKGICPGIVGKETLTLFHGAGFLSSKQAADLVLEGNPLNDEALEVAHMTGCNFLVNVTLDAERRITGVFAGDLEAAHRAAVRKIREYVVVPLDKRYDIVLVPAGFVGVNHYQTAKGAIEASRAVKPGGHIILVARNTDPDPIGGAGYKEALDLLMKHGRKTFMEMISAPDWKLIQEQWQVQMWCKVFDVIEDEQHFVYCSLDIPETSYDLLPGKVGLKLMSAEERATLPEIQLVAKMVERALTEFISEYDAEPSILFLKDGPYGIPEPV